MKISKCDLCGEQGQLKDIAGKHNLDTLSFLKNSDVEISEAKLCSKCQEKVQIIAEIKQETKIELPAVNVKEDAVEDDDVNLEELDILSR